MRKPWLALLAVWICLTTIASFAVAMPDQAGFADLEAYRAVFFHVPLAWAGTVAFMAAAWHSAIYLRRRELLDDARGYGAAETGLVMLVLATLTGMVFAKTQWGTWWHWDPRQTSVFFVILIYAGYLLLRGALPEDERMRAQLGAAYLLLAVAPMLWLVAYYPRIQGKGSLHPAQAPFDAIHWYVMLANLLGFLGVYALIMRLHAGIAKLRLAAWEVRI